MKHRRTAAAAVALGLLVAASGASAQDADEARAECEIQAGMVMAVVDSRGEGRGPDETVTVVQESLEGDQAKYAPVVPRVVEWVYTLPEEDLGDGVGDSWIEACVAR